MVQHDPMKQYFCESFFDDAFDAMAYCQMVFDRNEKPADFIYLRINRSFKKLAGSGAVSGKSAKKIRSTTGMFNAELFEICGRVSLTGKPERHEIYFRRAAKWFYVSVYSPRKKFFVAAFQDITDRKKTEKNFENAKIAARNVLEDLSVEKSKVDMARAKEEAILMSIGDGLIATDENGNIVHINKKAEKLLGKKSEEVIGKAFHEVIVIEGEKGVLVRLKEHPVKMALATGATTTTTLLGPTRYYVRKDKTKFPVAIMVTPVVFDKKVVGAIEVFRDITREKEIDKAKTEFVSLASHQLRTPLSSINWLSEMFLNGDFGNITEKQKQTVEIIYRSGLRMAELISALLNVSRLELGTFVVNLRPVAIGEMADETLAELEPQIKARNLKIIKEYSPEALSMNADPVLLKIVWQNLLSNAVNYALPQTSINVRIGKDKGGYLLEVRDQGIGIPKGNYSKIFTKLFRADNAQLFKTDGTGLGLYVTKMILDATGGKIRFDSIENRGTTFYVTLPIEGMMAKKGNKYMETGSFLHKHNKQ